MWHHAGAATLIATGALLYTALVHEPDLEAIHAQELSTLLFGPRPALDPNPNLDSTQAQFADLLVRYADAENQRLDAAASLITPALARVRAKGPADDGALAPDAALALLMRYAGIETPTADRNLEATLRARIAPLPPRLVASQAAIESAWGQSRFAQEGFNLFGHQCYQTGCGIRPFNRPESAAIEVRRFNSLGDSVAAYYQNINSHRAYRGLRVIRANAQSQGRTVTAEELVPALFAYSERGRSYLNSLHRLLRSEHLANAVFKPSVATDVTGGP